MAEQKYGVIHEIGDYSKPMELSDKDDEAVKEQIKQEQAEVNKKNKPND